MNKWCETNLRKEHHAGGRDKGPIELDENGTRTVVRMVLSGGANISEPNAGSVIWVNEVDNMDLKGNEGIQRLSVSQQSITVKDLSAYQV